MPLAEHYKGHGKKVMANMLAEYGDEDKAKRVFYATENKMKKKMKKHMKPKKLAEMEEMDD